MLCCFFFNDTATTEIYTLSLHDALPISSVLVLPLHHPLMLAEEIAQLDLQSAGRIDVGVGRGTEPAALRALQIDADSTRERFAQSCRILVEALSGRPIVAGQGPWSFEDRPALPSTVQRPH